MAEGKPLWQVFEEEERRMGSYAMLGAGWRGNVTAEPTVTITTTGSSSNVGVPATYGSTTGYGFGTDTWWYMPDGTYVGPQTARLVPETVASPWVFPAPAEVAPPPVRLDDFMVERGGERLIELD